MVWLKRKLIAVFSNVHAVVAICALIAVLTSCIHSMPTALRVYSTGKKGAVFGSVWGLNEFSEMHAVFKDENGHTYKVRLSQTGHFVLQHMPGSWQLISYYAERKKDAKTWTLKTPYPVQIVAGKVIYVGKLFASPVSPDVYLLDDFVRDSVFFRQRYRNDADRLSSGFANKQYYDLMERYSKSAKPKARPDSGGMAQIPQTDFLQGDVYPGSMAKLNEDADRSDIPPHEVSVTAFSIDLWPVTVDQMRSFYRKAGMQEPISCMGGESPFAGDQFKGGDKPAACVTQIEAEAYCKAQGKRLATEAEWELAAKGPNWLIRKFGGTHKPAFEPAKKNGSLAIKSKGWTESPYGVFHDAASIAEWTNDFYSPDYYEKAPQKDPSGPISGDLIVVRAGPHRFAVKPDDRRNTIGFRCVVSEFAPALKTRKTSSPETAPTAESKVPQEHAEEVKPQVVESGKESPVASHAPEGRQMIMVKTQILYRGPNPTSGTVAILHSGDVVLFLNMEYGWMRVALPDGRIGYLPKGAAK